jgi:uncharacterized protein (TIGR03083 family)
VTRSEPDLPAIYREGRERLVALADTLSEAQLSRVAPTCPDWTVLDLYAHLAGLAAETVSPVGRHPGSDEATSQQVADRRGRTIDEVLVEWAEAGPQVEQIISSVGRPITRICIDIWTHEQDIAGAAGVVSGRDTAGQELTMSGVWRMKRQLRDEGIPPFRVISGDVDWVIGDTEPAATVHIDPYELARATLGRRSVSQMLAYDWNGDPAPYVARFPAFTPPPYDIDEPLL